MNKQYEIFTECMKWEYEEFKWMFESLSSPHPTRQTVLYVTPIMNVEMTILSSGRRAFIILLLFFPFHSPPLYPTCEWWNLPHLVSTYSFLFFLLVSSLYLTKPLNKQFMFFTLILISLFLTHKKISFQINVST